MCIYGLDSFFLEKMATDFVDSIFKRIFLNEKFDFLTKISLMKGPIDNNSASV